MRRTRVQVVGRTQAGGLSLLLAVAVLAAAGTGVETARRVASASAGLALAMVTEPVARADADSAARGSVWLRGIEGHESVGRGVVFGAVAIADGYVSMGLADLPPPASA